MTRPFLRSSRVFVVALLVSSVATCKRDQHGWEFEGQVSRSSVWEYHDGVDRAICPTLLGLLDQHAWTMGGKIGLTVEDERPLRYFRFGDLDLLASACPPGVDACAQRDEVLTSEPFHAHEQAHAYVSRAWNTSSVGLVEEGVAVALSCSPAYEPSRDLSPRDTLAVGDWRPLLHIWGNSVSGYSAAGFWVTYLARKYGWPKVAELHRRVLPGLSAEDFALEFARTFPISMDAAWSEALGGGSPPCDDSWLCAGPRLSPGERVHADCDGDFHRLIDVTDSAGVVLTFRKGILNLHDCGSATAPVYEMLVGKGVVTTHWASLPPGTYAMSSDSPPNEVAFVSYLPSPLFASSCEQASSATLQPGEFTVVDLLPGTANGWLRLDGEGARYNIGLRNTNQSSSGDAALCESCDPAADCVSIPDWGATSVTIGVGAVLRLHDVTVEPQTAKAWGQIMLYPSTPVDGGA